MRAPRAARAFELIAAGFELAAWMALLLGLIGGFPW